jgi:hypothetical protein
MNDKEKKKNNNIQQLTGIDAHIQTALKSKSGVETMEKLLEMKYKHEAREASKLFHKKFCEMQANFPVIKKTKNGAKLKSGAVAYKYAPLDKIIKQIGPCMKEYGFSYYWTEENVEGNMKRIYCHIVGHGHEEKAYIDLPIMPAGSMTNAIQQYGSTITYGKRYSLIGILGLMADEDDNAENADPDSNPEPQNVWGEKENEVWKKISCAAGILGKNQVQLKEEFKIKSFKEFDLKALQDFHKVLNKQIDIQEKNNEK